MEKKIEKQRKVFSFQNLDYSGTIKTEFIVHAKCLYIYQHCTDLDGHESDDCIRLAPGDYKNFLNGINTAYRLILNTVENGTNK
jgi:hypothetical protein